MITGGPGTGKTTLVRGILAAVAEDGLRVALAAPTGRAARRLAESTGREARTLHRLLEADPERGFRRHRGRPLEAELVIVDEASMIDTQLMAALLEALPPTAALLLVGDVDQLPSIGAGQVLADVIGSGAVPVVRLTEIFRQAAESGIVRNAHRINRGELPAFARAEDGPGDCYGIRVADPEDTQAKLLDLILHRIPERFGLDPVNDVQVLTPVNRGRSGTQALNELLQAHLNPDPPLVLTRGQGRLALGDKVMQLENDYDREVYNGDVGRVTAIDQRAQTLEVTMDGRRLTYAADELDRLAIAYAVTVHKAQGSEYPAVVLPLLRQHGRMLRRNLLYTAITRARRLVVLLTEPEALERAVRDTSDLRRTTLLRHRLDRHGTTGMTPQELDAQLAAATPIVRAAGALALDYFRDRATLAIEHKGQQDLVSIADRNVEELLRERLAVAFPGDAVLGEEGGRRRRRPADLGARPDRRHLQLPQGHPVLGRGGRAGRRRPDRDRPHLRSRPRRDVHRPARRRRLPQRRADPRLGQSGRRHLVPGRGLQLPPAARDLRRAWSTRPCARASSIAAAARPRSSSAGSPTAAATPSSPTSARPGTASPA